MKWNYFFLFAITVAIISAGVVLQRQSYDVISEEQVAVYAHIVDRDVIVGEDRLHEITKLQFDGFEVITEAKVIYDCEEDSTLVLYNLITLRNGKQKVELIGL